MKARDRKAIKRYAARELELQRNELISKINRQRNEMEASIRRSIKQMDMKQLKVAYIVPGHIPAYAYAEYEKTGMIYEIAHKLANGLIENGMIEIEKQIDRYRGDVKITATVNVYADRRKSCRNDTLLTLGHIDW